MFQQIKDMLNIRQVVEYYGVKLVHNKALCPFHQEKNKSFSISDKRQMFNCHTGCGGGDLINFVAKMFGLKNSDACKKLNEDFKLRLNLYSSEELSVEEKKEISKRILATKKKHAFIEKKEKLKEEKFWQLQSLVAEYDKLCIENKPERWCAPSDLFIFLKLQLEKYSIELDYMSAKEGIHV